MTITYNTMEDFYQGIQALVERGLEFNANGSTLTIQLTGGY